MTQPSLKSCPCGSDIPFDACCQPYHQGPILPPTPEALMRSRYAAFALNQRDYLLATWHPTTRPQQLPADPDTQWVALEIVAAPSAQNDQGTVHFRATFREPGGWHMLEEASRFIREEGRWWYVDGTPSVKRLKPGRNEPCPCGSGRKLKVCCRA
ncbi:YchJ family protein [Vreelandella lutescens]|uniref:YchJ family protein n=1 Tax=Vreelandella lutescens TaxID=1602943 RepID=UPI00166D3339|nr:YchJ family metal-binding protein [Halomonas lutescens]